MCGIAGRVNHNTEVPVERMLLERMAEALRHRGPDDGAVWCEHGVGLASRRLKVIDLSERAGQPMANEDGSLRIVFNGEIYNFRTLRGELERRGHRFRSNSDTEVVLHLYEDYGEESLSHLRGMFALAIWDARRSRLFIARDRLGKKPLFYYDDGRAFRFASEPKAILQDAEVEAEPDLGALHQYLTLGYVPAPGSAFRGFRKLLPGHYIVVADGRVRIQRYWSLHYHPKRREAEGELIEELRSLLNEAVGARLASDVPLGALLSGGLDSSTVVATMRGLTSGPIRTFSIGFEEAEYDELSYAREVATRFETEHHELVVRPDAVVLLPKLVWHYGEPFGDSSAVPSYCLSEMARESVTVALAGDGGDESFFGYERYLGVRLAGLLEWLPVGLRRSLAAALRGFPTGSARSRFTRARRFAEGLALAPVPRYLQWIGALDRSWVRRLATPAFAAALPVPDVQSTLAELISASDATDPVEAMVHLDVRTYLPDDLLVKMDIASMAASLEVRSPLLDHHIVEFAARLPVELKLHGRTQKYLLRRAMQNVLPPSVIRRRKMGFGVPIDRWLRKDLRPMTYDLLLDGTARQRGYFAPAAVQAMLDAHVAGRAAHHTRLWSLLMLELWHRVFVDRRCAIRSAEVPSLPVTSGVTA